jgi:hypothetical protein
MATAGEGNLPTMTLHCTRSNNKKGPEFQGPFLSFELRTIQVRKASNSRI